MHDTPKYTLGENDNLRIVVFDQYGDFHYDGFLIVRPEESHSGTWEVWYAETEDGEDMLPIHKQLEIYSSWITEYPHVHLLLKGLNFGYHVGEHDGMTRMHSLNRFARSVLVGEADFVEMSEAANQAGFGIKEDGSNYGSKEPL